MKYAPIPWEHKVQKGSVLRAPSGRLRIVRKIIKPRKGGTIVNLTIAHCSWTGRCFTTYNLRDLWQIGYTLTNQVVPLDDEFDLAIEAEFEKRGGDAIDIRCCDVKGLP